MTVRLPVFSVSPMSSSLIRLRNGWTSIDMLGRAGDDMRSVIAAIIAGDDWMAVRCM